MKNLVNFFALGLLLTLAGISLMNCSVNKNKMKQDKPIEQVLRENTDHLMSLPGVVGTGQGLCKGKPCIKIYVAQMSPELSERLPKEIEGYLVDMEITGVIKALPKQ